MFNYYKNQKSEFLKELNCKNVEGEIVNLNDKVMCESVYLITGSLVLIHTGLRVQLLRQTFLKTIYIYSQNSWLFPNVI